MLETVSTPCFGRRFGRRRAGMTLVELTLALGILAVTVGGLIELQVAVNTRQQELWNLQEALRRAQNIADAVINETGNWQTLCTTYRALPGVAINVEDGNDDPLSGWAKVTVHVSAPSISGSSDPGTVLVFGRQK